MTTDDDILRHIAEHPNGISMSELLNLLTLSRRTLQNRVASLMEAGTVRRHGKGRATRYVIHVAADIPLTPEALEIQRAVRRPLTQRTPVGYHREFLDDYEPNVTRYLDRTTSAALAIRGRRGSTQEAGTYARKIYDRLLIDLSWASSRLEGNTYSLLDTEKLLQAGRRADGKPPRDTQMILNHRSAIEFLVENAKDIRFNRYTIQSVHALLAQNLLSNPSAEGRLRTVSVRVGSSVFLPLDTPQLIDETLQQVLDTAEAIDDPLEQALFMLVHLPYLQPFEDVNKRVSRLAANIPLIRRNLCPLSFVDVPTDLYVHGILGVYELNRVELLRDVFVWAYERSCQTYAALRHTLGEPDPFRLRMRVQLRDVMGSLVRDAVPAGERDGWLDETIHREIAAEDRVHFRRVVDEEIAALHMGNIARYRLRPSEFERWQAVQ